MTEDPEPRNSWGVGASATQSRAVMEHDESFDDYVEHMQDSACFDDFLETTDGVGENPPVAVQGDPGGANIREEHFTPKRSFLAESPYFNAFVEKEMHELDIVTDVLNDISSRTREFTKYGTLMADATQRLSLSCRLRKEEAGLENVRLSPRQMDAELEKRRNAVGPEISDLLGILGEVSRRFRILFYLLLCRLFEIIMAGLLLPLLAESATPDSRRNIFGSNDHV